MYGTQRCVSAVFLPLRKVSNVLITVPTQINLIIIRNDISQKYTRFFQVRKHK